MDQTWPRTVRGMLYAAMAVFLVTIVIGIINGLDLYEFEHDALLTHVHTGTLGWVTLTLVAMTAWYSRGIDRRLAWALCLIIPVYALAFMVAPSIRSVLGGLLFLAILALVAWAWGRYNANRTITSLAMALGFTTFTYGAIIGVLIQVQLAGIATIFPAAADTVGAHASAMVFSYLVLVAMGILEWRVLGGNGRSRAGLVQLALLFISGALLSFTLLFLPPDAVQPVGGLVLLLNLVSVGIFAARVIPTALRTDWMGGPGRHLAAAALFVVVAMVIFLYVIYRFITDPTLANDPTAIAGVLLASDHSAFIGVITNLVFAALITLAADRRATWPWADQVAFWGTNVGLVLFLVGLVGSITILKQIGAPLMGVALLVGLAAFAIRLRDSSLAAAEG